MNIDYTGRHFQLDDRTRDYAENKLSKLARFLDEPIEAHVVLEIEKRRQIAEIHVAHRHGVLQAKEEAEKMLDAVHAATDKLEKQARRARKKHTDKKRRAGRSNGDPHHWPLDILEAGSLQAGEQPRVIKKSVLQIKPMTVDEAAIQLDTSKNEFFVFLDSSTDRISVLYKRRDSHYGLIAPDF